MNMGDHGSGVFKNVNLRYDGKSYEPPSRLLLLGQRCFTLFNVLNELPVSFQLFVTKSIIIPFSRLEGFDLLEQFCFGLSLQLVIGHCNYGQYEIDQVERAQEDVDHEEDDVVGAGRAQSDLRFKYCLRPEQSSGLGKAPHSVTRCWNDYRNSSHNSFT